MAKNENGFFDGLVDDFCRDLELKAALEASRDENGKVDKWAALGGAMGLGHISDDDIVMMTAMLGAEGAFDPEADSGDDFDCLDDLDCISTPITTSLMNRKSVDFISETEYENKKQSIKSNAETNIVCTIAASVIMFIGLLAAIINGYGGVAFICLCLVALLGWTAYHCSQQRDAAIQRLDKEYQESKRIQEQTKIIKQQKEAEKEKKAEKIKAAKKKYEQIKAAWGSNDISNAPNQLCKKIKLIMGDESDISDQEIPLYEPDSASLFLNSIIYLVIKETEISAQQKSDLFDHICRVCDTTGVLTGKMLFLEYDDGVTSKLQTLFDEFLGTVVLTSCKENKDTMSGDFLELLCSFMLLLGNKIENEFSLPGFGNFGVEILLDYAGKALGIYDKNKPSKKFCGSNDLCVALDRVYNMAKHFIDESDRICNITYPTYDREVISAFLNSLFYFTIKECEASANQKAALFDLICCHCCTKVEDSFTGNMLFAQYNREVDESMRGLLSEAYTMITVAAFKSGIENAIFDFAKALCTLMLLLEENLKNDITIRDFGKIGTHTVLDAAQKAAQRVIDERLLDRSDDDNVSCDNISDSNINMDSIMNKVENLVSDDEFLSRKLAGKEFDIICDSCKEFVRITVSSELTGKCPVCGHENELTFSVK